MDGRKCEGNQEGAGVGASRCVALGCTRCHLILYPAWALGDSSQAMLVSALHPHGPPSRVPCPGLVGTDCAWRTCGPSPVPSSCRPGRGWSGLTPASSIRLLGHSQKLSLPRSRCCQLAWWLICLGPWLIHPWPLLGVRGCNQVSPTGLLSHTSSASTGQAQAPHRHQEAAPASPLLPPFPSPAHFVAGHWWWSQGITF
jgi:hypothetical protein